MPTQNISKELFTELHRLCLISLDKALRKLCEVGSWPRPFRARVIKIGHDFYGDDLLEITEVNEMVNLLASQDFIKRIYLTEKNNYKYILQYYWIRLVVNVLSETEGTSLSYTIFNKWFNRFIKELYTDTATWRIIDVFDGLILDRRLVILDQYSSLMQVPNSPRSWLVRLIPRQDNTFDPYEFTRNELKTPHDQGKTTLLVTTMKIPKGKNKPFGYPPEIINSTRSLALSAAIRMHKEGFPFHKSTAFFQISSLPMETPLGVAMKDRVRIFEKEMKLTNIDFKKVRKLWRELMESRYGIKAFQVYENSAMDTAIGRFLNSYENINYFEKILDLTIALEVLFSPQESQELSYRIALRCSWLLGSKESVDDSNRLYDSVRAMYDLRSQIVHGSTIKKKDVEKFISILSGTIYERSKDWELREVAIESARNIVRNSIKACSELSKLQKNGPCWPFPKEFDKNMVLPIQQRMWKRAAKIIK